MPSWNTISTILNGEISYYIKKYSLSQTTVDLQIVASSVRWDNFDIEFEYRNNAEESWKTDANLTFTSGNSINKNRVYNLQTSYYGTSNIIRWDFSKNNIQYGSNISIRIKILPRIRNFSLSLINYIISETYGQSNINLISGSSNKQCIGLNMDGKYICLTNTSLRIFNELSDNIPIYEYTSLNNPNHAIQVDSGNYIVSNYGDSEVLELDETLSSVLYTYSAAGVFLDYDNINSLVLITTPTQILEVALNTGTLVWSSVVGLTNAKSATYSLGNVDDIVITDYDENSVILLNKTSGDYTTKLNYKLGESSTAAYNFYHPYRAYKLDDDSLIVIEQSGKIVDFTYVPNFSSSSSSTSSTSSTSSSST